MVPPDQVNGPFETLSSPAPLRVPADISVAALETVVPPGIVMSAPLS